MPFRVRNIEELKSQDNQRWQTRARYDAAAASYVFIAKTPVQSRVRQNTHFVVMCNTSQCKLRWKFRNLCVTNVICIVTYYTLPPMSIYRDVWIAAVASSRTSLATLTVAMCNTPQCKLRSLRVNIGMLNVICIVTYYTLPPLESARLVLDCNGHCSNQGHVSRRNNQGHLSH